MQPAAKQASQQSNGSRTHIQLERRLQTPQLSDGTALVVSLVEPNLEPVYSNLRTRTPPGPGQPDFACAGMNYPAHAVGSAHPTHQTRTDHPCQYGVSSVRRSPLAGRTPLCNLQNKKRRLLRARATQPVPATSEATVPLRFLPALVALVTYPTRSTHAANRPRI